MTENEIKNTKEWLKDFIETYALSNQETIEFQKAVACLEEIQQYRAIGTVERFEQLSKQFAPHNVDETSCHLRQCNKCDMYRKENEKYHEIGTIDEFKALKEKNNKDFELLLKAVKESYPIFKGAYVELDVFMGDVMRRFTRDRH